MSPRLDMKQADGLRRLSELMRRINSAADLSTVLHEITKGVVDVLGHELAFITVVEGSDVVVAAATGRDGLADSLIGSRVAGPADSCAVTNQTRCASVASDLLADWVKRVSFGAVFSARLICQPLEDADGESLGCLGVVLPPDLEPSSEEEDLLGAFTAQAALALHNLRSRASLSKRLRLGNAIRALAEVGELDNLEETLVAHGTELNDQFEVDVFRVRIFRPEAEDDLSSAFVIPDSPPDMLGRVVADELGRRSAELKQPIEVNLRDGNADDHGDVLERGRSAMVRLGLGTCLICPIAVGAKSLGYVMLGRNDPHASWDVPEREAAMDLGRNLGRLVANAKLLQRERELVEELQALDSYRTELIATISHELKTPLTAIIGHIELLEDSEDDDISIAAIGRNAQRLDRLVSNLLTYSHALHSDIGDRHLVDLAEVTKENVELIRPHAEASHLELKVDYSAGGNWVFGDPEELSKVVINLLSNAVKYSRANGVVEVRVGGNETYQELCVTDHGIGISQADLVHLFSAFNRSTNQEVLSIPGTGLGLAISRRIAQMNGGEILVDSEFGAGSTFRFRLPTRAPGADRAS